MRAMICRTLQEHGRLELADLPPPTLTEQAVRIRVAAAGLNFADGLMLAGRYQEKLEPPFVPGMEVAGTVTEIGAAVTSLRPGDRVMAILSHGGYAEEVVAAESDVIALPAGLDFANAAAFPVAYGTSHHALTERARLQASDVLLVHGAAGGVGLTAVEIGHALGAVVIATAGSPEKLAVAADRGATHLIDYRHQDVVAEVRALTQGRGADVVYDPVGGPIFDSSLRCTAMDGRLLVIGFASGEVPQIPANILLVKNLTVIGYYWGGYRRSRPQQLRAGLVELLSWYEAGRIRPLLSAQFPLEEANGALDLLKRRGAAGKIVLQIDQNR